MLGLSTEITFFDENGDEIKADKDGIVHLKPYMTQKISASVKIPRRYIAISIPCWYRKTTHVARKFYNKRAVVSTMRSRIGHRMGFKNYTRVASFK